MAHRTRHGLSGECYSAENTERPGRGNDIARVNESAGQLLLWGIFLTSAQQLQRVTPIYYIVTL